jgi:hypothetical protein
MVHISLLLNEKVRIAYREFDSKYKQTWLSDNIGTNHPITVDDIP